MSDIVGVLLAGAATMLATGLGAIPLWLLGPPRRGAAIGIPLYDTGASRARQFWVATALDV